MNGRVSRARKLRAKNRVVKVSRRIQDKLNTEVNTKVSVAVKRNGALFRKRSTLESQQSRSEEHKHAPRINKK